MNSEHNQGQEDQSHQEGRGQQESTGDEPWGDWAFDGHGNLVDLSVIQIATYGPPEPTTWVNVMDLANSLGMPAAISSRTWVRYEQRIASKPYEHLGAMWVNLVHESDWWKWFDSDPRPPSVPRARPVRAVHVWVAIRHQRGGHKVV